MKRDVMRRIIPLGGALAALVFCGVPHPLAAAEPTRIESGRGRANSGVNDRDTGTVRRITVDEYRARTQRATERFDIDEARRDRERRRAELDAREIDEREFGSSPTRIEFRPPGQPYFDDEDRLIIHPRHPYYGYFDYYPVYPYYPGVYPGSYVDGPRRESRAEYDVEEPREVWVEGRYQWIPTRDVIDGEFVEQYYPPVYRRLESGELELIEEARFERVPRERIVLERVWVEGHYELRYPGDAEVRDVAPGDLKSE